MFEIKEIGKLQAHIIIKHRIPYGKYWLMEDTKYVAIDNSTGNAWTEEFDDKEEMLKWLSGD